MSDQSRFGAAGTSWALMPSGDSASLIAHMIAAGVVCIEPSPAPLAPSGVNGDGVVNYFDTFLYIPMLSTATGYCGNLNGSGDGVVNFFDTAKYLPYLANGVQCP